MHRVSVRRHARLLDSAPFEALEAVNVIVPDGLLIPDLVIADTAAAAEASTTLEADDIVAAVEIASPSTRVTDKKMKPALYAAAGIEHYWRLELDPAPRLYLGDLDPLVQVGETTRLTDPFPLDFDPARLRR
ncbi:Uma2 family endonuclease (plasmid) [Kitasatospora purpeofusca]|uniref:Uma2 family endonuclease n=1 Tax=Kitasatospora purpeofusca TaxID=67352 RepID=UPI002E0F46A2|nr:Uma2 family endonuclease [Kitasatospora purpeofusca]